jgi:hypothetical protein
MRAEIGCYTNLLPEYLDPSAGLPTRGRDRESAPGRSRETGVGASERDDRRCSPPGRWRRRAENPNLRSVGSRGRGLAGTCAACTAGSPTRRRATRVLERSFRSGGWAPVRSCVRHVETTGSRASPDWTDRPRDFAPLD